MTSGPSDGCGRMEQPRALGYIPQGPGRGGCTTALRGWGAGSSCLSPVSPCAIEESLSKLSRKEW